MDQQLNHNNNNNGSLFAKERNKFIDFMSGHKRKDGELPKTVEEQLHLLEYFGEDEVASLSLIRKPVDGYVGVLMDTLSNGKYKKALEKSEYDKMFHLSLCINGKWRLEKNDVINLSEMPKANPTKISPLASFKNDKYTADNELKKITRSATGIEFMRVVLPRDRFFTIRSLLDNTREFMGKEKFSMYSPRFNNCQDFIMGVLEGNQLKTDLLASFVQQDVETLFEEMPAHATVSTRTLVDISAVANNIQERIQLRFEKKGSDKKFKI